VDHSITQRSCLRALRFSPARKQVFLLGLLLALPGLMASGPPCRIVEGDRILMSDLAGALPQFASADPDLPVSFSPKSGVTRVFTPAELLRLARAHGIPVEASPSVCFVRPVRILDAQQIREAMSSVLPEASIEVIDFCKAPVPPGDLEFPKSGLTLAAAGRFGEPVLWKGVVRHGRSAFPVWARVKATVEQTVLVAVEALKTGEAIAESAITRQSRVLPALYKDFVDDPKIVVGAVPRLAIAPNQIIQRSALRLPDTVKRGSKVTVRANVGEAQLTFEATAESSGRSGDTVLLRNPMNGHRFKGRVEAEGKVVVN
jgi:flagella basal body P-ring formation protein FlgA